MLLFKKEFFEAIRAGRKVTTVRRWARPRVTGGGRAFCPGLGWLAIETVEPITLDQLDDGDAVADGFADRAALLAALTAIYPADDPSEASRAWFRVRFRTEQRTYAVDRPSSS